MTNNLQHMAELASKLDANTEQAYTDKASIHGGPNAATYDRQVDEITEQFFRPKSTAETEEQAYDVSEDMERSRRIANGEITADFSKSRLPKAILESFMSNPINISPDDYPEEKKIQTLGENAAHSLGLDGARRLTRILEGYDNKDTKETTTHKDSSVGATIDTDAVKDIIRDAIDEYTKENSIKALVVKENKFMILTNGDDLYECQLKYIGKNKRKRK